MTHRANATLTEPAAVVLAKPMSRREVLAFVALADAPAPHTIHLDSYPDPATAMALTLRFRTSADLFVWLPLFKVELRAVRHAEMDEDGTRYHYTGTWRGRQLTLTAVDPIPVSVADPLDGATRSALAGVR